jgi:hypothetical protein
LEAQIIAKESEGQDNEELDDFAEYTGTAAISCQHSADSKEFEKFDGKCGCKGWQVTRT